MNRRTRRPATALRAWLSTPSTARASLRGRVRWVVACLALLGLSGCYTGMAQYVPRRTTIHTEPAMLRRAVEDSAVAHGLRIASTSEGGERLLAYSEPSAAEEQQMRDRWEFVLRADGVDVAMHPEVRDGPTGRWTRLEDVCECYHYAREREMVREIRARVRRARREAGAVAEGGAAGTTGTQ